MPNVAIIGIEPFTGRVAIGRRAVRQLDSPVIERPFPSQLPYRAILYHQQAARFRLAPLSSLRKGEVVIHPAPFVGRAQPWRRPLTLKELEAPCPRSTAR